MQVVSLPATSEEKTKKSKTKNIVMRLFDPDEIVSSALDSVDRPELNIKDYAPSHFGASLLGLGKIPGLGHKGIKAIDLIFGISNVWSQSAADLTTCLHNARVPDAIRIAEEALSNTEELLQRGAEELEFLHTSRGISVLGYKDLSEYFKDISSPARWLFVEGNPGVIFNRPSVALVGTRQPTPDGIKATDFIAEVLSPYPITIISGLADGIDGWAHDSTLRRKLDNIAFLGHGINYDFPAVTVHLRKKIIDAGGAVVTEYLPNEKYQKSFFVERNRLQAALADLVIPIEAASNGGTAHTVRFAKKFNRPLIGIEFPNASGIFTDLKREGFSTYNVFESEGRKSLDQVIRDLVDKHIGTSYSLKNIEKRVIRYFKERNITEEDKIKFLESIKLELDKITTE